LRVAGAVALATIVLTACGGGGGSLNGNLAARNVGGAPARVGQPADYTVFVVNNTSQSVTLRSATLLPLRGFTAPRLAHVAVEAGRQIAYAVLDWPPGRGFDLRPFAGYVVHPGKRVQIMYSIVAGSPGDYVAKGVRVTASQGGDLLSVDALGASLTCVSAARHPHPCPGSTINRVQTAVERSEGG
jgi:hypothetical protein